MIKNIKRIKTKHSDFYFEGIAVKNEDGSPFDPRSNIETHLGYYPLTGVMLTKDKENFYEVRTSNRSLKAFNFHTLLKYENNKYVWTKIKELKTDDYLLTIDGVEKVLSIIKLNENDHAFDFRVEGTHCFLTNGIISHNSMISLSMMRDPSIDYIIYLDSEGGGVSKDFARFLGIDPQKILYSTVDTIEDLKKKFRTIIDIIEKNKAKKNILMIMDSISMLSTDKEMNPEAGCYTPSTLIPILIGDKIDVKRIDEIRVGDRVISHLGTWDKVEKVWSFTAEEKPEIIEIETEELGTIKLTPQHRLLVKRDNKLQWIQAGELTLFDELQKISEEIV